MAPVAQANFYRILDLPTGTSSILVTASMSTTILEERDAIEDNNVISTNFLGVNTMNKELQAIKQRIKVMVKCCTHGEIESYLSKCSMDGDDTAGLVLSAYLASHDQHDWLVRFLET